MTNTCENCKNYQPKCDKCGWCNESLGEGDTVVKMKDDSCVNYTENEYSKDIDRWVE
jgi:hypothetical protein